MKIEIATLLSDQMDSEASKMPQMRQIGKLNNDKGPIYLKIYTFLCTCNGALKYVKQRFMETEGKIGKSTVVVGYINTVYN